MILSRHFSRLTLASVIFLALPSFASLPLCWKYLMKVARGEKIEFLSNEVAILWTPDINHYDIRIGDFIYNIAEGRVSHRRYDEYEKKVLKGERDYYVYFGLLATQKEINDLKSWVSNPKNAAEICSEGTCKALNANTSMVLLPGLRQLPTLTAIYLTLKKKLGADFGRIESIEFVGSPEQYAERTKLVALDGASQLGMEVVYSTPVTGGAAVALVVVAGVGNQIYQVLVPIAPMPVNPDDEDEEKKKKKTNSSSASELGSRE